MKSGLKSLCWILEEHGMRRHLVGRVIGEYACEARVSRKVQTHGIYDCYVPVDGCPECVALMDASRHVQLLGLVAALAKLEEFAGDEGVDGKDGGVDGS